MKMTIWQTPAGIVDEGGVVLPSWLNFGITLLGPPANGMMHVRMPLLPQQDACCPATSHPQVILPHAESAPVSTLPSYPGLLLQGVVGGTYDRYLEGETAVSKPESQLYLPPDVSRPPTSPWHTPLPKS